jgi:hypothetical protein
VWTQIDQNPNKVIGNVMKPADSLCISALDIFESILERPLDSENFGRFLILLKALLGTKAKKYASNLVKLLQSVKLQSLLENQALRIPRLNPAWNLMQYLLFTFMAQTEGFES